MLLDPLRKYNTITLCERHPNSCGPTGFHPDFWLFPREHQEQLLEQWKLFQQSKASSYVRCSLTQTVAASCSSWGKKTVAKRSRCWCESVMSSPASEKYVEGRKTCPREMGAISRFAFHCVRFKHFCLNGCRAWSYECLVWKELLKCLPWLYPRFQFCIMHCARHYSLIEKWTILVRGQT